MVFSNQSDKPETPDESSSPDEAHAHHFEEAAADASLAPIVDDGQGPLPGQRQLVLNKRGQRHVFRYQIGEEVTFIRGIQALAASKDSDITWFDAAVLSHQMGQWLGQDMHQRNTLRKGA